MRNVDVVEKYLERFIVEAYKSGKKGAENYVMNLGEKDVKLILESYGSGIPKEEEWAKERVFMILRREAIRRDRNLVNILL